MGLPSSYSSSGWGGQSSLGKGITHSGSGSYTFGGWGSSGGSSSGSSSSGSSSGSSSSSSYSYTPPKAPNEGPKAGSIKSEKSIGGTEAGQVESVEASSQDPNSATISEFGYENNYNNPTDFSWVTPASVEDGFVENNSFGSPWTKSKSEWDNKANEAREIAGYNQRKERNWTYNGDWRATDKPASGKTVSTDPNYKKYLDIIAPKEMETAWKEAEDRNKSYALSNEAKIGELRDSIKGAIENTFENPNANEFNIGKKAGKAVSDFEEDYRKAVNKYGKGSNEVLVAESKLSAALAATIAIGEVAIPQAEEFFKMSNVKPGKKTSTEIGDYTYTIENFGKDKTDPLGNNGLRVTIYDSKSGVEYRFEAKSNKNNEFSMDSIANEKESIAEMVDKSMKTFGLKTEETPEETTPETSAPEPAPAPVPAPEAPAPETTPEVPAPEPAPVEETSETVETVPEATINVTNYKERFAETMQAIEKTEDLETLANAVKDVSVNEDTIKSDRDAEIASEFINVITNRAVNVSNDKFRNIFTNILEHGGKLQDISKNENVKKLSQEIFDNAQAIFDKSSELEAYTEKFGLNNISRKEMNRSLGEISDQVSLMVGNIGKEGSSIGTYYSPGSDMNGLGYTGVNLTKSQQKALIAYSKTNQATKDACIALMKSAAFNGAVNSKGGEYSEAWKDSPAVRKGTFKEGLKEFIHNDKNVLTWKDWFSASAKGTASLVAIATGAALFTINPVAGALLMVSGFTSGTKTGVEMATMVNRANSTNAEAMFGSGIGTKDVLNDIYNRSFEEANIGDIKSVGTYTTAGNAFINGCIGMTLLSDPLTAPAGISFLKGAYDGIKTVATGGLKGNLNSTISTVYALGENINNWANLGINLSDYMSDPSKGKEIANEIVRSTGFTPANTASSVSSDFGVASDNKNAENKFSGFAEEAKNKNLATDYNAGMEENVNEVVSDENVKGYIVRIYKSEPDWLRSALDKILKMHSERDWG